MPILSKPDHCRGCIGWKWTCPSVGAGFIKPRGTGVNGVLLVGEAAGEDESLEGKPFVGKAGAALDKMMQRGGLNIDDFLIYNVLACRPPNNKLSGEPYAEEAIKHCSVYLDAVIADFKPRCIVALGVTAFRRIIPEVANLHGVGLLDSKKHKGARGYVFWSHKYQTWVLPTTHPSFIMRGKTAWAQVLIHDMQRGVEIAAEGYSYNEGDYLLDPSPMEAMRWVEGFEAAWVNDSSLMLSVDIETPIKDSNEEDLDLEDGADYIILRCGYSYADYSGMSLPWGGIYRAVHERLLAHPADKCWWNASFDVPRILASK